MAGPPQISDPNFRQFSEAGPADTTVGDAINAITQTGSQAISNITNSNLREKVKAERERFLNLQKELGDDTDATRLNPETGEDGLIRLNVDNVIQGTLQDNTIVADARELAAMDAEIQNAKRAVQQGLSPTRALEMNVEAITRRYIDRYPGLAAEFQRTAQTALGTSNNLLTATMRSIEELQSAQLRATDPSNVFHDAHAAGFEEALNGATPEIRTQAVVRYMAAQRRSKQLELAENEAKLAALSGNPTIAQKKVNEMVGVYSQKVTADIAGTLAKILPPDMQASGLAGVEAAIANLQDGDLEETLLELKLQRTNHILNVRNQLSSQVYMDENARSRIDGLVTAINGFYDGMEESISGKQLNEITKIHLQNLQNFHNLDFEQMFGPQALLLKNILSLIPVDSRLQNLDFRNRFEQSLMEDIAKQYGLTDLYGTLQLSESSVDPDSAAGQRVMDLTNEAMIDSFEEFLELDGEGLASNYPHARIMNGFANEFDRMAPEVKNQMLDLLGTDKWAEYWHDAQRDPKLKAATLRMKSRIENWGGVQLQSSVEQLARDAGTSDMTRRFGIFKRSELPDKDTMGTIKLPVLTKDLVNIKVTERGMVFTAKTPSELKAAGLDTEVENLNRINSVVSALNAKLATGLNAYARSLANIGEGNDRRIILDQVMEQLIGEIDAESE